MQRGCLLGGCALLVLAVCQGCGTMPPEPVGQGSEVPAEFQPAFAVTMGAQEDGTYADLFSPSSYAVWVSPEVAEQKRTHALHSGQVVDPELEREAASITQNFVVIECHVESVFGDTSIAYDVVGFRGVDVYLETPDGREIEPIQRVIGSPVEEEQRGSLKAFRRTNLLVFPRRDLWEGRLNLDRGYASVKLVLQAQDSRFAFEWPDVSYADPTTKPPGDGAIKQLKVGFSELFESVRRVAHVFD